MVRRKILWVPEARMADRHARAASVVVQAKEPRAEQVQATVAGLVVPKNGNGHKSLKVREMTDSEKRVLKSRFMHKNGEFKLDDIVRFKNTAALDLSGLSVFQLTGFVSSLHREVACGRIKLENPESYARWIKDPSNPLFSKYPGKKCFYDIPEVRRVREANWGKIAIGLVPDEKLGMSRADQA